MMQIDEILKNNLMSLFDFTEDYMLGDVVIPLYGKFYMRNSRYVGSKKIEMYASTIFEHMLYYKHEGEFLTKDFEKLEKTIIDNFDNLLEIDDVHMSSLITLIVEASGVAEDLKDKIKKYKFKKTFSFGLKGWADIKLIVLDRSENVAYESKIARGDSKKLKLLPPVRIE
ncbi:MAG TPA: hypothetical protein PLO47_00930 [Bacillota bacterium]|nr:hypothetical protein [Bacillota bacterium]